MHARTLRDAWFGNLRGDLLAGIVVALALIPEALAFSIIAGVDPKVGLYAASVIAIVSAIAGGRPGMISAATGAVALLLTSLVRDHGVQYMLAAGMLAGVLQIGAGLLRLGELMRFVSRSVMTGFVNALAILIFLAQLPQLRGVPASVYGLLALGLAIIYLLPRVTRAVPSPLVCIVVLTALALACHLPLRTVGEMGAFPDALPAFALPHVPLTFDTLRIVLPYSIGIAAVGLLESLMTAAIVDDYTDTPSDKNRECRGQGCANIAAGLLGGMPGCAMIGQTVINMKSGGRGRLSTLTAGVGLLVLVVFLGPWVRQIPMVALVAVMVMVSISTFSWKSILNLRTHPASSSVVMLATVAIVVATGNLAIGVFAGVLLSALFFASKVRRVLAVDSTLDAATGERRYTVRGQVFFASSEAFVAQFDFHEPVARVRLDVSHAHLWDITAIDALDRIVNKFRRHGVAVELSGLNRASATMIDRYATHDKAAAAGEAGLSH
ncbi:SulP family inorganic anion transporter [Burkholderia glumae]|uniref:SulP family inorganic anion transporter n=1 Tax=Burkholderia glumae TaxID=337 RepID=UPI000F5F3537|nr:SulP family inorganic anion transporter [Burkholderia glumae]MCQ0033876.1 SulP family inorganic anion transporter [Burkholderia glumae]MCQ0037608.1 SulP family inorganic anion transporter [Burkholderia glumae]QJW80583.1 SulP family inorganic anion transporter [Burkholderia glumae]RQZ72241.1 SulP family inorganic anion transporter [Burkholderia glumae]UVS84181.1 SulP family inorganic anion transporter [Burkholderia glumae]